MVMGRSVFEKQSAINRMHHALQTYQYHHRDLFHQLFWRGCKVKDELSLQPFLEFGLVERSVTGVRAAVQIWSSDSMFIFTDRPDYPEVDRVFPIFSDESLVLGQYALQTQRDRVLDIGTGSGILAIQAASAGAEVVGIDISARALSMAQLNIHLNAVSQRVTLVRADALRAMTNGSFDLIIANPPFVPVPDGVPFHLAGNGGPDGLYVIRQILLRAGGLLSANGMLVITAMSLQRDDGYPYVAECAVHTLPKGFMVRTLPIYKDRVDLREFCGVFREWDDADHWRNKLERRGFNALSYVILVAARYDVEEIRAIPVQQPARTPFSGTWEGRFARYRYWLQSHKTL